MVLASAKIVLATTGSLGDLHPFIGLGQGLVARGHRVAIATTLRYQAEIEVTGLGFCHMRPDPPDDPEFHRRFMDPKEGGQFVFQHYLSPAIAESFNDLRQAVTGADLLVSQSLALAAPIVAYSSGIRWASAVFQPMMLFSACDPPAVPPMPLVMQPQRQWQVSLNQKILEAGEKHTRPWTAQARHFAENIGVTNYGNPIFNGQHAPACVLAMFSPLLGQPMPDWPAHSHQTGSILYAPPNQAMPLALQTFLDEGPPPVLFTLGSSSARAAGDFFDLCLAAAHRLGQRALLLTGQGALPPDLPSWALALPYAPFIEVFPKVTAIVHGGGIGSLMMALQAGKPQVAVTYAHDQHDNALRGARLGAVIALKRNELTTGRLTRALRQALTSDQVSQAAQAAQRQLIAEDPVAKACDCLEQLLTQGSSLAGQ